MLRRPARGGVLGTTAVRRGSWWRTRPDEALRAESPIGGRGGDTLSMIPPFLELLKEAGYPNGFTFKTQVCACSPDNMDLLPLVAGYLEMIGVKMEIQPMEYGAFLSAMTTQTNAADVKATPGAERPFDPMAYQAALRGHCRREPADPLCATLRHKGS